MPVEFDDFAKRRRLALKSGLAACFMVPGIRGAWAKHSRGGHAGTSRSERFLIGRDPATIPPPPAGGADQRTIDVPDGRISYLDTGGTGEVIVLLHATTGTARSWDYQLPALKAAGYRAIAIWRRGTPESASGRAPTNTLETRDLLAFADGLGLRQFHLLGTASGGFIAIRFAVAHEARLYSLTLANSLLGLNQPEFAEKLDTLLPDGFQAMPSEFKELSASYRMANPEGVKRWLEIEAGSVAAILQQRPDMAARMRAGVRGSDGPDYTTLQTLNLPVHLIYGDADLYAPPALARILAAQFRQVTLSILGESGHASHWEQPENFNTGILSFLSLARSRT